MTASIRPRHRCHGGGTGIKASVSSHHKSVLLLTFLPGVLHQPASLIAYLALHPRTVHPHTGEVEDPQVEAGVGPPHSLSRQHAPGTGPGLHGTGPGVGGGGCLAPLQGVATSGVRVTGRGF